MRRPLHFDGDRVRVRTDVVIQGWMTNHMRGAKSGEARTSPLLYTPHDGGFIVVASKADAASNRMGWPIATFRRPSVRGINHRSMTGNTLTNSQPPTRVRANAYNALSMRDFCSWDRYAAIRETYQHRPPWLVLSAS
jgi:hypothetical protein